MKKVFLLLAVFASALSASAQTVRGETLYYYVGDSDNDLSGSFAIENTTDPASVPITVSITNPTKYLQSVTFWLQAPTGATFVADGRNAKKTVASDYSDADLWQQNALLKSSSTKVNLAVTCSTKNTEDFVQPSDEPIQIMTVYLNASNLADGDYEVSCITDRPTTQLNKCSFPFDGANSGVSEWASIGQKIYVFADTDHPITAKFTKSGDNITGVSRVIADEEVADKSIYTVDGIKVKTMQPNHLYIVNGKKVVVGK